MRAALLTLGREHGRPGTTLEPNGIVVHSTASADLTAKPDPTAKAIRNYFENGAGGRKASAHISLDWNESLVLIPCWPGACERAWHAGPIANSRFIGIELVESDDVLQFKRAFNRLIKIVKLLTIVWEWPIDENRIWSHKKASETWHETTHVDPDKYLARWNLTFNDVMVALKT